MSRLVLKIEHVQGQFLRILVILILPQGRPGSGEVEVSEHFLGGLRVLYQVGAGSQELYVIFLFTWWMKYLL